MIVEYYHTLPADVAEDWKTFLRQARHAHPRQSQPFAAVETALGHDVVHVVGRCDGKVCAVGQFSLRHSPFWPRRYANAVALSGPVCDDAGTLVDFMSALTRSDAFARVDAIIITPYWLDAEAMELAQALDGAGWALSDPEPMRYTGLIDLTRSAETMLADFSANARRKVRMVKDAGVEIRPLRTLAETKDFFDRLNRFVLTRHRLTLVSQAEYEAAFKPIYCQPSHGVILGAWQDTIFLGGLLLYRSARYAHARRYVADPVAGKLRVAPALWYQGMLWAKEQGCTMLDVEGFRLVDDKEDPHFNVYEYKRELRPQPVVRIGERTMVLNAAAYHTAQVPQKLRGFVRRRLPGLISALQKRT